MNAIEAQLLQNSIQNFGASGERRAQRTEQARQFDLTRQDRLGQMGIENEMNKSAAGEHRAQRTEQARQFDVTHEDRLRQLSLNEEMKKMQLGASSTSAQNRNKLLENQQIQQGIKTIDTQIGDIQKRVDSGALTEEEGSRALRAIYDNIDDAHQAIRQNSLLGAYESNGFKVHKGIPPSHSTQSTAIVTALDSARKLRKAAQESPEQALELNSHADMIEKWAHKQGEFAPQKQAVGYEETTAKQKDYATGSETTTRKRMPFPVSTPTNPATNAAPKQAASGVTATNPKTGEKIQFINGKWQPIR